MEVRVGGKRLGIINIEMTFKVTGVDSLSRRGRVWMRGGEEKPWEVSYFKGRGEEDPPEEHEGGAGQVIPN